MTALLLVAHGTRDPAGPREIERISAAVAERLDVRVHASYVDVIGPTVGAALHAIPDRVIVLPAFLASGYHVRTDLPEQIAASGAADRTVVGQALGPAPEIADAMVDRLTAAGWQPGRKVVFSAAGSADSLALADVRAAARLLGKRCGQWLRPSYVTTAQPLTTDVCGEPTPAFIAPYLLAPGLFHQRLTELPVTGVAEPIGAHPLVIDLIARRYKTALHNAASAA